MSNDFNEWVDYMSQWQDIVRDVPAIVHQDIQKARMKPQEPSRGMQSLTEDPLAAQYALGYKDRRYSLTYDVLKRIPHQLAVIGAIIQVRQNQVAAFSAPYRLSKSIGFEIKHKDPSHLTSKSEQRFIRDLEQFVYNCGNPDPNPHNRNKRDDFETFLKKIVRDSLTLDQACHLAGSWVELADGTGCPIEDIQEGVEVRTHTGEIKKVLYPTQRLYSGELVTIHVRGQRVTVTSGHPVYAAKRISHVGNRVELSDPEWVPAGELTEDMWVVYPRSARCSEMADYWGVYKDENSLHTHLYVFSQIESIEKYEDENVPVYNMEVEDDHSYIAQGFINHNCVEIVPDRRGIPYEFMAVDGSTIRIAAQNSVYGPNQSYQPRSPGASPRILNAMGQDARGPYNTMKLYENAGNKEPAYVQVTNGQVHTVYTEDELMFGVRNPRTDIYIQGYGYCLHPDSRVHTEDGLIRIEDLCDKQFNVVFNGEKIPATAFKTGEKEVHEIKFSDGRTVKCSEDHKFYCLNSEGYFEWKALKAISEGDVVASSIEGGLSGRQDFSYTYVPEKSSRSNAWSISSLDSDLYEVLGWLVGDGNYRNKDSQSSDSVSWFYEKETERDILRKHSEVLGKYFLQPGVYEYDENSIIEMKFHHKGFGSYLSSVLGFKPSNGGKKPNSLPEFVFKSSTENVCSFLRGLFSADGNLGNSDTPVLGCTDLGLLRDVQRLLIGMGIRSMVFEDTEVRDFGKGEKEYDANQLYVYDKVEFFRNIGFIQEHKQPKIPEEKYQGTRVDKVGESYARRIATDLRNEKSIKSGTSVYRRCTGLMQNPPRWSVTRKWLSDNCVRVPGDLCWSHSVVKSVKSLGYKEQMYDVSVFDDFHGFSVDGIVVHNSELEQLVTIVTAHLNAETYNRKFFTQGSHPKGILNIKGDAMTPDMLEGFRRQWRATLEGVEQSWKTPILQAEQGLDWIDLHPSNRDMEFNAWIEYLLKVSCAIYMIDPAELNFDLHGGVSQTPLFESSQEWKLKASRDKGLKPLLRFIAKQLNEHVINKIDPHYVIEFSGLDEPTEQEKHTLYSEQVSSYLTLNEIRRAQDRPDLKYGDMPMSPAYLQAMQIQQQQEQMEQQQQQEQAMQGQQPQQPQEEGNEEPQEGQQRQGNAPEYADSFGKSQSAREGKYLEIDISELDDWKDSL